MDTLADDAEVTRRALGLGHQYVAQRRLRSSESVSVLLFQTALQLARNRGLFDPGPELAKQRAAFLTELRDLLRRIDRIEDLALRRYIRDAGARHPAGVTPAAVATPMRHIGASAIPRQQCLPSGLPRGCGRAGGARARGAGRGAGAAARARGKVGGRILSSDRFRRGGMFSRGGW